MLKTFSPQRKTQLLDNHQTVTGKKTTNIPVPNHYQRGYCLLKVLSLLLSFVFLSTALPGKYVTATHKPFDPDLCHTPLTKVTVIQWAQHLSSIIYCDSGFWSSNSNQSCPGCAAQQCSSHIGSSLCFTALWELTLH